VGGGYDKSVSEKVLEIILQMYKINVVFYNLLLYACNFACNIVLLLNSALFVGTFTYCTSVLLLNCSTQWALALLATYH